MYPRCCRTVAAAAAAAMALAAAGGAGAENLPSNRAYELVSPAQKYYGVGGGDQLEMTRAVRGGDSVFFEAFHALPGSADGMGHDSYRADRGPLGWSTTSLVPAIEDPTPNPSGDQFAVIQGMSQDGQTALYLTGRSLDPADQDYDPGWMQAASDLYLRGADGTFTWASPGPNDPGGFLVDNLLWGVLSPDGSTVLFQSQARLLPDDAGRTSGLGLYDWRDGALHLVGVDDSGTLISTGQVDFGSGGSGAPANPGPAAISDDGRRIFFRAGGRAYVRIDNQITRLLAPGSDPSATQTFAGATPDGSLAYFTTTEQLTSDDTDTAADLYEYDVSGDSVRRLSGGDAPADVQPVVRVSNDGQRVYFLAQGALTADAPQSSPYLKIYEAHAGTLTYVGLSDAGGNTPVPGPGCTGSPTRQLRLSPDGRHLVWSGAVAATADDQDTKVDVFEYSEDTGEVVRVSGDGAAGNGGADVKFPASADTCIANTYVGPRGMSDDGRFVFFQTPEALVPEDTNGEDDVYQHDLETGETSLISSGVGDRHSLYLDNSASGRDVFFMTYDPLVGQDPDTRSDIYDARIGGGFPVDQLAPACVGDDCQGSAHAGLPPAATPGSATVKGSTLPPPPISKRPTLVLTHPTAAQLKTAARTGRLKLSLRSSVAGKVRVRARTVSKRGYVLVASRTATVPSGRTASMTIVLSKAARQVLRRNHRLTLSVRATLTPGGVVRTMSLRLTLPKRARGAAVGSSIPSADHR